MILRTRTNGHCSHLISPLPRNIQTTKAAASTLDGISFGRSCYSARPFLPSLAEPISTWTFVFRSTESHSVPHCSGCTLGQQDNFPALVLIWLLQSGEFASLRSYNCYNAGAACPVRGVGGNNVTASTQCVYTCEGGRGRLRMLQTCKAKRCNRARSVEN